MISFILLNLTQEGWRQAIEAFLQFKSIREKAMTHEHSILVSSDNAQFQLSLDGVRIFILEQLIAANLALKNNNMEVVLSHCNLAAQVAAIILDSNDNHFR